LGFALTSLFVTVVAGGYARAEFDALVQPDFVAP
jgi:hypothetical protein